MRKDKRHSRTKRLLTAPLVGLLAALTFATVPFQTFALSPARPRPLPEPPELPYSDSELNMITNVVNGEVGGITGTATITYADGSTVDVDACLLHIIHARVLDNQVKSEIFPDSLRTCISWYWTSAYTATGWRTSERWQHCRQDVLFALWGCVDVPDNVLAATCDPYFADRYPTYSLWAKVKWDTGWVSGTFYYYQYGG